MNKAGNLASIFAVLIGMSAMPVIAADELSGTGMGDTTRTSGPTGTPGTTGEGGSASREGLLTEPNYAAGIGAEAFVEQVTGKNHAIIKAAESILDEKSAVNDPKAREFAQQMITAHKQLNRQLIDLAGNEKIEVSDAATLIDQAQSMVLSVRGGESLVEAYANNQVGDHQALLDLFDRAAVSDLGEITQFAKDALPKLEAHLEQARALHPETRDRNK
ncbi:DUF4142 domain-containing protein [Halopseudomonas salina]|uniref:DUF4142 domain-containing protein n=1 Tax=Halopseudomonas salina TaxID=1323744 RepID=A0ABQ1NZW4_9GAMM|nr:DUF4142 domain-containing protein [Halopseudomonas salina]GGC86699.1 hypothetical protein GCM10007418_03090 [Halopseudomonas salina]